jgi:hypothetical protein
LGASADPIDAGASVNLSGVLAPPDNAVQTVQLFADEASGQYAPVATTLTDGSGNYSFTQTPIHNTVYQARAGGGRQTVRVFEGVRDVVTIAASAATSGKLPFRPAPAVAAGAGSRSRSNGTRDRYLGWRWPPSRPTRSSKGSSVFPSRRPR